MNYINLSLMTSIIPTSFILSLRADESVRSLPPLLVRETRPNSFWGRYEKPPGNEILRSADAASVVENLPGAAIVRNGAQTGIVQLRGLSGDRVAIRVDGMSITPACPNHMDPPLHYADLSDHDIIEIYAGISPVSEGGDHIGGSLSVSRKDPEFAKSEKLHHQGELSASYLGSQNTAIIGADYTIANTDAHFTYRGSASTANDMDYPGGSVRDSGYENMHHGIEGAWRTSAGYIAVNTGLSSTRDAGTPALPMDMIHDDAWHLGVTQSERFSWGKLENRIYMNDIDHLMDNHSQRPLSPGTMAMDAPANSRDYGWRCDVTLPSGDDTWRTGLDFHRAEFDAEQIAVASSLKRDTFNDNQRSRGGVYLDWERKFSDQWTSRIGVRGDCVSSDADAVSNAILPASKPMQKMILADQHAFNSSDRSFTDAMVDATAALRFKPDENTGVELALALKNRAPSLVERYLWTPLNASAGLADGRSYLGNLELDPESAFEIALGFTRNGTRWNAGLTPFYQSVSDYIQGMPITRLDASGKNVLQFQNIDRAELYGFEITAGYDITSKFTLDSVISYVRGRSDETGGDLYRIAPLRGLTDLAYRHESWESHLEFVWADAQSHVASTQDETPSPGYGLLNLRLAKTFMDSLRIELGVENLLDKLYSNHLGGVNRVRDSDVGLNERIPEAGRFFYGSISWKF